MHSLPTLRCVISIVQLRELPENIVSNNKKLFLCLQAKSVLENDDTPPLSHYEAESLARSETYSVTSEESYSDRKLRRRKTSGSSRDSGAGSMSKDIDC